MSWLPADGVEHHPPPGDGWDGRVTGPWSLRAHGFSRSTRGGPTPHRPGCRRRDRLHRTGTHQGSLRGHEPTGTSLTLRGKLIGRLSGGTMVQRWDSGDQLGMLSPFGGAQS